MAIMFRNGIHHPTRMAGRLHRCLKKYKVSIATKSNKDLLAESLGHGDWQHWMDGYEQDPSLICREISYENAMVLLVARLTFVGVPKIIAIEAAHKTFDFGVCSDPRQIDLLDYLDGFQALNSL